MILYLLERGKNLKEVASINYLSSKHVPLQLLILLHSYILKRCAFIPLKTLDNDGYILGVITSSFHNKCTSRYGFSYNQNHFSYRLTSWSVTTGTDPRYINYCYGKLTNLSTNHSDTSIVLNRGLTASNNKSGGLRLWCKDECSVL